MAKDLLLSGWQHIFCAYQRPARNFSIHYPEVLSTPINFGSLSMLLLSETSVRPYWGCTHKPSRTYPIQAARACECTSTGESTYNQVNMGTLS